MTSPYSAARWHAPLATTGLWALAAGAAVFWALRLASPADMVAAAAAMPAPSVSVSADSDAVARLLGVLPASSTAPLTPEAASRFALSGVVADPSKQGAALIAIDGKAPRPFRVGSRVGDNYVLQSVGLRSATLGAQVDGPAAFTLQLPVRAPISVTSVPSALPTVASPPPVSMSAPQPAGLPPAMMPAVVAPPPQGTSGPAQ